MGLAIDTVGFFASNPGASPAAGNVTVSPGDSLTTRNFQRASRAQLLELWRQGATEGFVEVRSPAFHDVQRGLHFITSETPARFALPTYVGEPLQPGDTLTVTLSGGTAEVDAGAMSIYYEDAPGMAARLASWGDISGSIDHLKFQEVDFNTNATAGNWQDTVITTTENILLADRTYAVLGYTVDTNILAFGIKSQETGNLRICGVGTTETDDTGDYFITLSNDLQKPCIPLFSANNRAAVFVSALATQTSTAIKSTLVLALLSAGFGG